MPEHPLEQQILATRLIAFDFDGVFTDNMVYISEEGREWVRCYRGDGIGLRKLEQLGIERVIISTETNQVVKARSRKLGIRCMQGRDDKPAALEEILREHGWSLAQAAFVGNDVNDAPLLERVGLPIVVADAHPGVISFARYQTAASGGHGAVREVCDLFERVLTRKPESMSHGG